MKTPITEKFLKEQNFKFRKSTEIWNLKIENSIFIPVEIEVQIVAELVIVFVAIKIGNSEERATLNINFQEQLIKLIESIKGE